MDYILEKILQLKKNKKLSYVGHIIAGYPTIDKSIEYGNILCNAGLDFLEVQFPFSDPTADGPTIETACYKALENNFRINDGFKISNILAKNHNTTIIAMTYANIIFKYGIEKFIIDCNNCGIKGIIIPDLPIENDEGLNDLCDKYNIANILIAAPGASKERIKFLSEKGKGFLYTVARRGITGKKTELDKENIEWLLFVKKNSILPIGVGFGIQSKEQIEILSNYCDLVIIGSYFVNIITDIYYNNKSNDLLYYKIKELFI